ncbi:MAG: 3-oxoacyl-[acyl-carrier-protein] reductase [Oligoflexia bacterium]|nr:3-oxoacyl-[acyl-carrier-protein] reductase [Oligoflexia bacterium]
MSSLKGKIALVTGASRGIGKSIALELAASGAFVVLNCTSRGVEKAEDVLKTIRSNGGDGMVKAFSVSDSESVNQAVDEILKEKGAIHILVNNAGIAKDALFMRMKDEEWDDTLNTNLKGSALCARAVVRPMMKAKEGVIINITSVVGEMGNAGQAAYSASKAGLIGLTKTLAKELASRNIRVNAIAPGFIDTEMTVDLPESAKSEMLKVIPMGRMGSGKEIADAVLWLASDKSTYITGQVISINGGMYV